MLTKLMHLMQLMHLSSLKGLPPPPTQPPINPAPPKPYLTSPLAHNLFVPSSHAQTFDAILDPQFWQFASTENTQGVSVEDPHNSIHVFCG